MENSRRNIQGNQFPSSLRSAYNLDNWGDRLEVGWGLEESTGENTLTRYSLAKDLLSKEVPPHLHFAFCRESWLVAASFRTPPLLIDLTYCPIILLIVSRSTVAQNQGYIYQFCLQSVITIWQNFANGPVSQLLGNVFIVSFSMTGTIEVAQCHPFYVAQMWEYFRRSTSILHWFPICEWLSP